MIVHQPKLEPLRRWAWIACLAAIAASTGDCLLLWHGLQSMPEHSGNLPPPEHALLAGYYLGIIGLPLYALGYWGISRALSGSKRATIFFAVAATGVISGALMHGGAALGGHALELVDMKHIGAAGAFLAFADFLLPLVVVSVLMTLIGAGLYSHAVATGRSMLPRWAAAVNPLSLMLALAVAGLLAGGIIGQIMVFAAPNVAHIFLFGCLAIVAQRRRSEAD